MYLYCKRKAVCEEILVKQFDVVSSTKRSVTEWLIKNKFGRFLLKLLNSFDNYFYEQIKKVVSERT